MAGSRPLTLLVVADVAVSDDDLTSLTRDVRLDAVVSLGDLDDFYLRGLARRFAGIPMLAVRGNHDTATPLPTPFINLHGRTVEFAGRIFGGLEGCCRYRPDGQFQFTQEQAAAVLDKMESADVLLCHNSPAGVHEPRPDGSLFRAWASRRFPLPTHHAGFTALREFCEQKRPDLLLHGHQHVRCETLLLGGTRVVGVYGATRASLK